MSEALPMAGAPTQVNSVGLSKNDYRGNPTTLCQGCGHNSISNQIIAACYEANVVPEKIIKFSGIGCSSKSPTYFLNRSFGFNSLHGRMPSLATGALFGDHHIKGLGISGDGDSASIGMGQFKHAMRAEVYSGFQHLFHTDIRHGKSPWFFSSARISPDGPNQKRGRVEFLI